MELSKPVKIVLSVIVCLCVMLALVSCRKSVEEPKSETTSGYEEISGIVLPNVDI